MAMRLIASILSFGTVVTASQDLSSLLQQPVVPRPQEDGEEGEIVVKGKPFLIDLRRESVPVYRRGKIASYKTSYSGVLNVGRPAQEFRVVFDTGSGNIVLPAAECKTEACLVEGRRRFNMSASSTAVAVNSDGSVVPEGEVCDQVTIGFGTGEITGEFTRDRVCFGAPPAAPKEPTVPTEAQVADATAVVPAGATQEEEEDTLCVEMSVVLAVEMSTQPFKTFRFDGILGLGLDGLAMNKHFSAFEMIMGSRQRSTASSHFGVFLAEGEFEGEESQIAMGGVDESKLLEPLHWAPVSMPELGYWQIPIKAVRVDGKLLDVCTDGTCRGVVDTGTSHLGVPAPFDKEMSELMIREAGDTLDCRLIEGSEVEIELEDYKLTLHPHNYMRRLPLREGVSVSSAQGVYVPSNETNKTLAAPSAADPAGQQPANASLLQTNHSSVKVNASVDATGTPAAAAAPTDGEENVRRFCTPRLMPVRLPEPLGPKLFILGEPVLHRYYTVYDWENHRVGFSLANNRRNTMDPSELTDRRGELPKEVDMLLMQERAVLKKGGAAIPEPQEEVALVQMTVTLKVTRGKRQRRV